MPELLRRSLTGAVFAVVVLGAVWVDPLANVALWAIVGVLCYLEWRRAGSYSFSTHVLVAAWLAACAASMGWAAWDPDAGYDARAVTGWILMVWANDTFAYLTGRLWGKHKLMPTVSPGKTWEGFAGGLIGSGVVAAAVFGPAEIGAGVAVAVLATAGDLTESAWKRRHGLKDSGSLLPGHGGAMDRFDGFVYVAPAFAVWNAFLY